MTRRVLGLAAPGLAALWAGAAAAAPASQLSAACASCHTAQTEGSGIPRIEGQEQARIVQSMLAYRSGQRASQIMHVVSGALSPEEIDAVARYLSLQQKAEPR